MTSYKDIFGNLAGYTVLRNDRDRQGGGVCAYIRDDIAFNTRQDLQSGNTESLWFEILLPKCKPIFFAVFYRPEDDRNFLQNCEDSFAKVRSDCELIIMGDMNIDFLNNKRLTPGYHLISLSRMLKITCDAFNLSQLVLEPTASSLTVLKIGRVFHA